MKLTIDIPYATECPTMEMEHLTKLVMLAHYNSARNQQNASTMFFTNTLHLTGSMANATASAVLTLGETHAPIAQAREVFEVWTENDVYDTIQGGYRVFGYGNSFHKDSIDPAWYPVWEYLSVAFKKEYVHLGELTSWVNTHSSKPLYPNPAMFSAILCHILRWRVGSEMSLFILARIPAWVESGLENQRVS